jgi:hypothetical protein
VNGLPRAFSDLVMKLLCKDRTKRPQTAREVVKTIELIEDTQKAAADAAVARAEKDAIPVAKVLKRESTSRRQQAAEDVPVAKVLTPETSTALASGIREQTDSEINRRAGKKGRPASRKKSKEPEIARMVLLASLALLGVAVMVLVIGILTRAGVTPNNADLPENLKKGDKREQIHLTDFNFNKQTPVPVPQAQPQPTAKDLPRPGGGKGSVITDPRRRNAGD